MPSLFETLPYTAQAFLATLFTWAVTAAGAALVFFFGSVRKTLLDAMLGFAAGVMIAASFWSLLSPAIEMAASLSMNAWIVVLFGFLSGGILLFFGDKLFLLFEKKGQRIGQKRSLMLILSITLHNIPEGMAVSVPLISGGMTKWKAVLMTALSGVPTIIGALLGFWLGDIGAMGLALSLGFASGAMLYVVFGEILPQAILMYHSKLPAFTAIAGVLVGLFIIYA